MSLVLYSVANQTAYLTLNRPEKRNALSPEIITELKNAFDKAEQDASVKVVVLKANGESFCAGADLNYLQQLQNFSYEENLADSQHLKELFLKIYTLKKVVIPYAILRLLYLKQSLGIPKYASGLFPPWWLSF